MVHGTGGYDGYQFYFYDSTFPKVGLKLVTVIIQYHILNFFHNQWGGTSGLLVLALAANCPMHDTQLPTHLDEVWE